MSGHDAWVVAMADAAAELEPEPAPEPAACFAKGGSPPKASHTASDSMGKRWSRHWCHNGKRRKRPSSSRGMLMTPRFGGCAADGHKVLDGMAMLGQI